MKHLTKIALLLGLVLGVAYSQDRTDLTDEEIARIRAERERLATERDRQLTDEERRRLDQVTDRTRDGQIDETDETLRRRLERFLRENPDLTDEEIAAIRARLAEMKERRERRIDRLRDRRQRTGDTDVR